MNDLGLSPLVSDGMVIQREAAFPLWSRKKMTASFLGKTYEARQKDGKWLVTLDPVPAGGPFTMDIVSDEGSVTIKDIYSGDVWMCAGQSNMEMQMHRLRDDFGEEWRIKDFPLIREFKVPQKWDFSAPRDELSGGSWFVPSVQNLHEFSAVAWFFARKMYEKHRIPIGLVNTAWGGTPVETWMSKDSLASFPDIIAESEKYADDARCKEIAQENTAEILEWETSLRNKDLGLAEGWEKPQTDISGWSDIALPGDFAKAGLEKFCGVVWLAKDFDVSADITKEEIKVWLGTIVDADTVYINGVEIGNTAYRYPPRKYVPSGLLKQGRNRIVIRVTCNNGEGGVTQDKPFKIFSDNETVELSGTWKYKTGATAGVRPSEFFFHYKPIGNYNAMIAPVLKFPFKGVIWYQGESNTSYDGIPTSPADYAQLFSLMIQDWRKKSGETLPFMFVQLPIWLKPSDNDENSPWALLREAQAKTLSLPATGMAVTLELGEWNDLHPINKKDIGIRLYLAAEKTLFNENNTSPGPMVRSFQKRQGKVYIYFDNCGSGLTANEKPHVGVVDGGATVRLSAEIEGADVISVDISSVKNPQKILYAWADNPRDRQLFNSDGLPAVPFRIEI